MELTPVKFLLLFLLLAVVGYVLFTSTARLVAWMISRMIGGAVHFRIAGPNGIKEISIDLHKGPVAYLTISDLKVSLRRPPGTSFKLQLTVSDVEVVLRRSKSSEKPRKLRHRSNPTGRGKWMLLTNIVKCLNVSVNEIVVKVVEGSSMTLDIKELEVDTFINDAAVFSLGMRIYLAPVILFPGEDKRLIDSSGILRPQKKIETNGEFYFSLEHVSLTGTLDHDREAGIVIKYLEAGCGDAVLNVSAELMSQGHEKTMVDTDPQPIADTGNHDSRNDTQSDGGAIILARKVPETIKFSLPKFVVEARTPFGSVSKNEIKEIFLHGSKSRPSEGSVGVISVLDVQLDLGEIHFCQYEESSVLDVLKVSVTISMEFPTQLSRPLRVEVDVKLGGTQVNLHFSKYEDLMQLALFRPQKRTRKESSTPSAHKLSLSWGCSISAPEMAIFLYDLDQWVFMQVFSQTAHLYINILPRQGVVMHAELGELYLNRIGDEIKAPAEFLVGVESCSGCIIHVSRIAFDKGVDIERAGESPAVLVETGTTEVFIGMPNIKTALFLLVLIESRVKKSKKDTEIREKQRPNRGDVVKIQLEQLVLQIEEQMHVEDSTVPDPKKVNFGSQGGMVIITKQEDNLRTARIKPVEFSGAKQKLTATLAHIAISLDRHKKTTLFELVRGRMVYEEMGLDEKVLFERTLLAMDTVKLIYRPAKLENEMVMHFLLSSRNVTLHWDPDVHLFFYELSLGLRDLLRNRGSSSKPSTKTKTKIAYAIDIEDMSIGAELADGVEGSVHIHSLFSEDAVVGMLFEHVEVALNCAAVARIDRLQVSRVPSLTQDPLWDIVIQGAGVLIIMPYRLPLRAIEDAVEDMWRGLKLAMVAKRNSIRRNGGPQFSKRKDRGSFQVHSLQLHVRGITAEIEEEPLQGWLDEHYRLLRQQCRALLVRERLLEEASLKVKLPERRKMWEQLQEHTFQEYKRACSKLVPSRGSGACQTGFQAGFKPSMKRASLMSITADNLELTLTKIEGEVSGMIEVIRRLDCVKPDLEVPFSRLYGGHAVIGLTSLAICLRDYTPMLSASSGRCEGNVVFAQQATCFQKQMLQQVYIGRWRNVEMLRSVSGTTPPYKFYSELPIELKNAKVCYGVGFEPAFADVSYAFTVALRKYNLSHKGAEIIRPPKKEKSLPWWDDMRYYVHGFNSINATGFEWDFLATADPYETQNRMHMVARKMLINQTEGILSFEGDNFDMYISSAESSEKQQQFIHAPVFQLGITMDWTCASGDPLNHYLHAFPSERQSRPLVYDPFRSLSLSLIWSFALRTRALEEGAGNSSQENSKRRKSSSPPQLRKTSRLHSDIPFMNLCAQDLIWIFKWWNLYFSPPHKIRSFSRWPRFGAERLPRSGNLSLDKVLTEFILRVDSTPASIRHTSLTEDDPAHGLTFSMQKLRYELCYSRGLQKFTFETKRDILDLVYQGLDIHLLKTKLKRYENNLTASEGSFDVTGDKDTDKLKEDDFLLSTDCFTMRRQSPKADTARLSPWRENVQVRGSGHYRLSDRENSDASDSTCSDPSDDDSLNAVLADNCLRVSLYGLKLFWTVRNRDAVWAWAGDIAKAFEAPKPSPSRQYAQRKLMEEKQKVPVVDEQGIVKTAYCTPSQELLRSKLKDNVEEEETLQFMVNVIQPQFNLHSEDAHGRFLLAAASGRVLARSFHSTFYIGLELFEQALSAGPAPPGSIPELSWKRRELSVLLEHVQAHVAPTDVDPGAGIQWLPRIPKGQVQVKRTGALLERVFLPCSMYFQYIRHKGGSTDCKAKALKDLSFNSPNITATMTSRQFHIIVDVLSNLLFATLPKPRQQEEEQDLVEATDEVVPDGVEEVELAKIKLEQADRDIKLLSDDLKIVKLQFRSADGGASPDQLSSGESPEGSLGRALTKTSALVRKLESEVILKRKERKMACASVRSALHRAAQQRLLEREKNRSPSAAMRISWAIDKVVWSMLSDGDTFAEAEISSMILNVDRDFNNVGVARFTIKSFVVRNCVRLAKSNMVLSAWNPPAEWGRNVMLRVDAKQGPPKEGVSLLELFQVEIYPLKIHLTEIMYSMMWEYFFPGDEQDPQKRQEAWNSGTKRSRRGVPVAVDSHAAQTKEVSKIIAPGTPPTLHGAQRGPTRQDLSSAAQKHTTLEHQSSASLEKHVDEKDTDAFATDLVLFSSSTGTITDDVLAVEIDASKTKESRKARAGKCLQEDKKEAKIRKIFLEIHNIKISQVELLVTYEGSKFSVSELRLLMDTFTRTEFTGSWRRLFSRVKKHIIWGVLKSVTGMQGKKFKDKMQSQGREAFQDSDSNSSDSGSTSKICTRERFPIPIPHFSSAGEGFVSSIRGLFNSQRRKMVRTLRTEDLPRDWSDDDIAARAALRSKSKLLRRHSKKQRASISKGSILLGERYCPSPRASSSPYHSDGESSSGSSTYEDFDTS